jgi:hypothetical protein
MQLCGEARDFLGAIQGYTTNCMPWSTSMWKVCNDCWGPASLTTLCVNTPWSKEGAPRGYVRRCTRLWTKIPGGNLECATIVMFDSCVGEGAHSLTRFQPKSNVSISSRKPMWPQRCTESLYHLRPWKWVAKNLEARSINERNILQTDPRP